MTETEPLSVGLCRRILEQFEAPSDPPPSMDTLQLLLQRYTRTVPWESASRIVRRAGHESAADCAMLGADFWESHFELGTGGTCYESNYALFGLLLRLGYEGYLTINDMGASIGCHSAIVVLLDGQKYLVDVGLPVHAVLPIHADRKSEMDSRFLQYRVEPQGENRYAIWRQPHPRSQAFLLVDEPVSDADYRAIAIDDYRHDGGQFLSEIVINKVVDEELWRFNSDERPLQMQQFVEGKRQDHVLREDAAREVAEKFGIAWDVVAEAMEIMRVEGS